VCNYQYSLEKCGLTRNNLFTGQGNGIAYLKLKEKRWD
jgi:hypothetical protein